MGNKLADMMGSMTVTYKIMLKIIYFKKIFWSISIWFFNYLWCLYITFCYVFIFITKYDNSDLFARLENIILLRKYTMISLINFLKNLHEQFL